MNNIKNIFRDVLKNLQYVVGFILRIAPLFFALAMFGAILAGFGGVCQSYFISKILDGIIENRSYMILSTYAVIIILFQAVLKLQNRLLFALNRVVTEEIGNDMEYQILSKLDKVPVSKMDDPKFLSRLEQARNLTKRTPNSVLMQLFGSVSLLVGTIGYVVILGQINFYYILILAISTIWVLIANNQYEENVMAYLFSMSPQRRKMAYYSDVMLNRENFEEIRSYNAMNYLRHKFQVAAKDQLKASKAIFGKYAYTYAIATCTAYAGCGVVYLLIIYQAIQGTVSIGDAAMFLTACIGFQAGLTELIDGICALPPQLHAIDHYRKTLEELDESIVVSTDIKVNTVKADPLIEAKNLSFAYPGTEKIIIRNATFTICSGECVALVGKNGSGKTTLVRLLAGLYRQYAGEILIQGIESREMPDEERKNIMAVMFQNYLKPSLTIGEAISFDNVTAQNAPMIEDALSKSHYSVRDLPNGLNSSLTKAFDPDGIIPSGGQWQKLALARVFYQDASLYILDEPSAALDPKAEDEVFRILLEMKGNKTILFITHRLASVSSADRVLFIANDGSILQGTHDELMNSCHDYYDMYMAQASKYQI